MVKVSPSRIKTAQECSWRYWSNYKLKVPDNSNDGAKRGSICHAVLEYLATDRHKEKYEKIMSVGNVWADPTIARYIQVYARKLGCYSSTNLDLMNGFIMVGLQYDFWGDEEAKPSKDVVECEFNFSVDEDGKKYFMRGFIDRLFVYEDQGVIRIRDYKTSQAKFTQEEVTSHLQVFMYQLAAKKMYPQFKIESMDFLFLKFKTKPLQQGMLATDEMLDGLEYYLTDMTEYLTNFSEEDATNNLAWPNHKKKFMLCGGKPGVKKDGTPKFQCPYRHPFKYWAKMEKGSGNIKKTAFTLAELDDEEGFSIRQIDYKGCPAHYPRNYLPT